jgi:CAAX prenyl protease-like protein
MTLLRAQFSKSPLLARVVPFVVFLLLTGMAGQFDGEPRYWIYLAKTVAGGWLLWLARPYLAELKWNLTPIAFLGGIIIVVLWIGLDDVYPKWGKPGPEWNPHQTFGTNAAPAWFFILVRVAGSSLVVPPLEEVFYRSFIYRYAAKKDWLAAPLNQFLPLPFFVASALFAVEHREWLPGLLTGFILQGIVIRTNRLGDAIVAHAVANLLLSAWVIWRGAWNFW